MRGGTDLSILDDGVSRRSVGVGQGGAPGIVRAVERSNHCRGLGAIDTVSGGYGNHREYRHQPASSVGDDGGWTSAPNDGAVRTPRSGRNDRAGPRGAEYGLRSDGKGPSRSVSGTGAFSD